MQQDVRARGPLVWLDMDQEALDNAYDQLIYAPNRDQVLNRYKSLNVPTYWAGVNSDLTAKFDAAGKVTSVQISYPRDFVKQQLGYSAMYALQ